MAIVSGRWTRRYTDSARVEHFQLFAVRMRVALSLFCPVLLSRTTTSFAYLVTDCKQLERGLMVPKNRPTVAFRGGRCSSVTFKSSVGAVLFRLRHAAR